MLVKEIMKQPIVIDQDTTLKKAAELLTKYKISSLIMVKADKFVGLITEKDLVAHFGSELVDATGLRELCRGNDRFRDAQRDHYRAVGVEYNVARGARGRDDRVARRHRPDVFGEFVAHA